MSLLKLPKFTHPDFVDPQRKPTGPVELDESLINPDLYFMLDGYEVRSMGGIKAALIPIGTILPGVSPEGKAADINGGNSGTNTYFALEDDRNTLAKLGIDSNTDFSIFVRIKPTSLPGNDQKGIFEFAANGGDAGIMCYINTSNQPVFAVDHWTANTIVGPVLSVEKVYDIIVTYDAASATSELFVNGVSQGTLVRSIGQYVQPFELGRIFSGAYGDSFDGLIYDFGLVVGKQASQGWIKTRSEAPYRAVLKPAIPHLLFTPEAAALTGTLLPLPKFCHPDFVNPRKKPVGAVIAEDPSLKVACWAESGFQNVVGKPTVVGAGITIGPNGQYGKTIDQTSNDSTAYIEFPETVGQDWSEFTIITFGARTANLNNRGVFGNFAPAHNTILSRIFQTGAQLYIRDSSNTQYGPASGGVTLPGLEEVSLVYRRKKIDDIYYLRVLVDGVWGANVASGSKGITIASGEALRYGYGYSSSQDYPEFDAGYLLAFNRALSDVEIAAILKAPFRETLEPAIPHCYFVPGASGGGGPSTYEEAGIFALSQGQSIVGVVDYTASALFALSQGYILASSISLENSVTLSLTQNMGVATTVDFAELVALGLTANAGNATQADFLVSVAYNVDFGLTGQGSLPASTYEESAAFALSMGLTAVRARDLQASVTLGMTQAVSLIRTVALETLGNLALSLEQTLGVQADYSPNVALALDTGLSTSTQLVYNVSVTFNLQTGDSGIGAGGSADESVTVSMQLGITAIAGGNWQGEDGASGIWTPESGITNVWLSE